MNELVWVSEQEQNQQLEAIKKRWKISQGRDGFMHVAEGTFKYKGINYIIKVARYYTLDTGFMPMLHKKSDMHAMVEFSDETKELSKVVSVLLPMTDFLYHDTLHSWADNWTIEEQIANCHEQAHSDINLVFKEVPHIIREKHPELFGWIE